VEDIFQTQNLGEDWGDEKFEKGSSACCAMVRAHLLKTLTIYAPTHDKTFHQLKI
jgi:hypothetical protein